MIYRICLILCLVIFSFCVKDKTKEIDPNKTQLNQYVHEKLSDELLLRIKKITDVFEEFDGISYEKAIDLYKRDLDPESNIVIYEEMARVFMKVCEKETDKNRKKETYILLLMRSMLPTEEAIRKMNFKVLTKKEAYEILNEYKLDSKPIEVITKKKEINSSNSIVKNR